MRHPRNTEFTWQQPMPPYQLITSEQANAYREVGGFIAHLGALATLPNLFCSLKSSIL